METARSIEAPGEARKELESLRMRAAELEAQLVIEGAEGSRRMAAAQAVTERWSPESPIVAQKEDSEDHLGAIVLKLAPEEHDERMGELLGVLQEQGLAKAIAAAEATGNPHLIDDFHRVLVEYVHEGLTAKGMDAKAYKIPLSLSLLEITLPAAEGENKEKSSDPSRAVHELVALMEQFYRGSLQMDAKHGEYFSFEIANPAGAAQTSIYVAMPSLRRSQFEKQLLALYPTARLVERYDDYNAFAPEAAAAASVAKLTERSIYSLRSIDSFSSDPLDVLLNAFSQLDKTGEGAAVQFVISPGDGGMLKRYQGALERIRDGVPLSHATKLPTGFRRVLHGIAGVFYSPGKQTPEKRLSADDPRLKSIQNKVSAPILYANIRIVASAADRGRAQAICSDIEATFQQYTDTAGNGLDWKRVPERALRSFAHAFSWRLLDAGSALPLSANELAILAHVPRSGSRASAPELRQEKSHAAGAPADLPHTGTLLGINAFRGTRTEVYIQPEDRLRHLYLIGQTGTGKSSLLKNLVAQDIKSGAGVCFIDPHGTDVLDILSIVPPERMDDVIYFDPGSVDRPMGLNMLEYDENKPEQKTLVVDELLGIFKKLFGAVPESMGPAFEQYFRNAALLVMEDPGSGNTLLDISRVFADSSFRARKLAACKNPVVARFWNDIAMQASGEQGLENYAPYVTNKFDAFTTNEIVRPIIAQQKSAFNFRDLMDNRKILLVNLAKGRIGELNANLLGLVIVGKFLIAALSRADSFGKDLPPFYLHIDEFQNFATPSIASIFSEARKYKLSLTVAHQFIAQLTDEIRNAVFGNVGSLVAFRVGPQDAEALEKQFAPVFSAADLTRIDNFNAHIKLLVRGKPAEPFNIETLPFLSGGMEHIDRMKELSFERYGRPRAEIEADIGRTITGGVQEPATLAQGGN